MDISFLTPLGGTLFALFAYGLTLLISLFVALIVFVVYKVMGRQKGPGKSAS